MYSKELIDKDIITDKCYFKKKKIFIFGSIGLLLLLTIILIIVLTTGKNSEKNESENNPNQEEEEYEEEEYEEEEHEEEEHEEEEHEEEEHEEEEKYIENIDNYSIANFKLDENNNIINTGLSDTSKIINYKVEEGYFHGGKINLNSSFSNATIIGIVKYNYSSKERLFLNDFAYYGGAIDFKELTSNSQRKIGIAFGGGEIETNYTFPEHSYLNKYYDGKYLLKNEDMFFALTTNSLDAKSGGKYAVQINEDYIYKNHWCSAIKKSFGISNDHKFKEIRIYNTQLSKKNLAEEFQKSGIKLNSDIFSINNFTEVDNNIDNSKYESLHIINKINILYLGYKYALSAIPYPFEIHGDPKADQYDVNWESSDESIAQVIDGLVIPKKLGKVTIKAQLLRTKFYDTVNIEILNREKPEEKIINIPKDYKSKNNNVFSDTNYEMTSQAIFDAIDEAYFSGYNHIIFPKINFYCHPLDKTYYIPTGMTIEFPKGSKFFMKPSEKSLKTGYVFFSIGWRTWETGYFYNIPKEKAFAEKNEKTGKITGYYIDDVHLIIDKYYGEFYDEKLKIYELAKNARKYRDGCKLINFGKFARYSSIEIHNANCTSGFFISMGGATYSNEIRGNDTFALSYLDFTEGRLNDKGENDPDISRWFTTNRFFEIGQRLDGTDFYENYVLTNIISTSDITSYHSHTYSSNHLYDIAWYDENKKLIQIDRWRYVDENYKRAEGAKFYKISIHQTKKPNYSHCVNNKTYIYFMPAGSSHFCEIKNTNLYHSADGLVSVVGETNSCWIHNNYIFNDGYLYGWSLDLEDGWLGIRGTILENNIIRKFAYSTSQNISYSGPDSGNLALSGGFNTFVINNYIGSLNQVNYGTTNTHVLHNTIGAIFGSYNRTDKKFYEIRANVFAHVYNNVIGLNNYNNIDYTQNGKVYYYGNYYDSMVDRLIWVDKMFKNNSVSFNEN